MATYDNRLSFTCNVAKEAGALALAYFNDLDSLTVLSKGVQDMASEADVKTELLIRDAVVRNFPGDAFLGEESADEFVVEPDKGTWIIDPIDGTQPFVNGIRSWCVSIAFYEHDQICLGVVYDPTSDELFAAQMGGGATLNGQPIHASDAESLLDGLVSVGYSNRVTPEDTLGPLERLMRANGMYHRSGSGALSLAYVAAGRLIGYFEPHMNSWDFAAGAIIIREAGGRTNDCLPNQQVMIDGGMIVAAADGVFDELSAVVSGNG
jgi:myo-inositol-1(or 4)-monophosphatase